MSSRRTALFENNCLRVVALSSDVGAPPATRVAVHAHGPRTRSTLRARPGPWNGDAIDAKVGLHFQMLPLDFAGKHYAKAMCQRAGERSDCRSHELAASMKVDEVSAMLDEV